MAARASFGPEDHRRVTAPTSSRQLKEPNLRMPAGALTLNRPPPTGNDSPHKPATRIPNAHNANDVASTGVKSSPQTSSLRPLLVGLEQFATSWDYAVSGWPWKYALSEGCEDLEAFPLRFRMRALEGLLGRGLIRCRDRTWGPVDRPRKPGLIRHPTCSARAWRRSSITGTSPFDLRPASTGINSTRFMAPPSWSMSPPRPADTADGGAAPHQAHQGSFGRGRVRTLG